MSTDRRVPWLLTLGSPDGAPPPVPPAPAEDRPTPGVGAGGRPPEDCARATRLPADALGLALGGDGARGATFGLGFLQALARAGWLRRVDFLSTVSGGGYVGAFLGRFFDLRAPAAVLTGTDLDRTPGAAHDRAAAALADDRSPAVDWLRRNTAALAPTDPRGAVANAAEFWRGWLAVVVVLGLLLFAALGVVNAVGYSSLLTAPDSAGVRSDIMRGGYAAVRDVANGVPESAPVATAALDRTGVWPLLAEAALWLAVVPLMLAYWLIAPARPDDFEPVSVVVAALLALTLLLITGSPLGVVVLTAAVLWALAGWRAARRTAGYRRSLDAVNGLVTRNALSRWLAVATAAAVVLVLVAAVDAAGARVARATAEGETSLGRAAVGWAAAAGAVFAAVTLVRLAAPYFLYRPPGDAVLVVASRSRAVAALLLVVGLVPPAVAVAFSSHAAYDAGRAYARGAAITGVAVAASLLLGSRGFRSFANRSSRLATDAGRLARVYLGAVNPLRRAHPVGASVAHVVPGDDVPLAGYAPHAAGGPLHLLTCGLAETADAPVGHGRAGGLAVGPAGVSVARDWHALWTAAGAAPRLAPVPTAFGANPLATPHPAGAEALSLGQWVGISGATIGAGTGRPPGLAASILLTLTNLRFGYWWDSGLRRTGSLLGRAFRAQRLLLRELTGWFAGPWGRYWHLSDGGDFEPTGAYELLRRRLPYVVVCHAGTDRDTTGAALARLMRTAGTDFGAAFEEVLPNSPLLQGVPPAVKCHLGGAAQLLPGPDGLATCRAVLFLVTYPAAPRHAGPDGWLARRHTWLLYLTATRTADDPTDVRAYAAGHPAFPLEPTADLEFDAAQWESYRRLGEHAGAAVLGP